MVSFLHSIPSVDFWCLSWLVFFPFLSFWNKHLLFSILSPVVQSLFAVPFVLCSVMFILCYCVYYKSVPRARLSRRVCAWQYPIRLKPKSYVLGAAGKSWASQRVWFFSIHLTRGTVLLLNSWGSSLWKREREILDSQPCGLSLRARESDRDTEFVNCRRETKCNELSRASRRGLQWEVDIGLLM